jgi:predicted phosphodiesterase
VGGDVRSAENGIVTSRKREWRVNGKCPGEGLLMRIAWGTDVHLNFVSESRVRRFCEQVTRSEAEALLLGGDIAEAPELEEWLRFLERELAVPIYFVLGNHDYYGSHVSDIEARMSRLDSPRLHFLPHAGVIGLTKTTGLVGHGGSGELSRKYDHETPILSARSGAAGDVGSGQGDVPVTRDDPWVGTGGAPCDRSLSPLLAQ